MSRLLRGCRIEPLTEIQARSAGTALAAVGGADIVDAALVVSALARRDLVVTSDPVDVSRVAAGLGRSVALHVV
jgi:hypothetical protein